MDGGHSLSHRRSVRSATTAARSSSCSPTPSGVSMLVDLDQPRRRGAARPSRPCSARSTSRIRPGDRNGDAITDDLGAQPLLVSGHVRDTAGTPAGGRHRRRLAERPEHALRGAGRDAVAGQPSRPVPHRRRRRVLVPHRAAGGLPDSRRRSGGQRCCARPAAIRGDRRTSISSCPRTDAVTVTTHVFDSESPYLESDAVFGVKQSLVRTLDRARRRAGAGAGGNPRTLVHGRRRHRAASPSPQRRRASSAARSASSCCCTLRMPRSQRSGSSVLRCIQVSAIGSETTRKRSSRMASTTRSAT